VLGDRSVTQVTDAILWFSRSFVSESRIAGASEPNHRQFCGAVLLVPMVDPPHPERTLAHPRRRKPKLWQMGDYRSVFRLGKCLTARLPPALSAAIVGRLVHQEQAFRALVMAKWQQREMPNLTVRPCYLHLTPWFFQR
jgi:hypothetical protein